jgi:hypothetical protein
MEVASNFLPVSVVCCSGISVFSLDTQAMKTKFLVGKDYPWLCSQCQQQIDLVVGLMDDLPDTDDEEGPCMYVYDHALFCGGTECKDRKLRPEDGLSPKDFTIVRNDSE